MEENSEKKKREGLLAEAVVYRGVAAAARRAGCSREHLSRVLHGWVRPGKRLACRLAKMGVEVERREERENEDDVAGERDGGVDAALPLLLKDVLAEADELERERSGEE